MLKHFCVSNLHYHSFKNQLHYQQIIYGYYLPQRVENRYSDWCF